LLHSPLRQNRQVRASDTSLHKRERQGRRFGASSHYLVAFNAAFGEYCSCVELGVVAVVAVAAALIEELSLTWPVIRVSEAACGALLRRMMARTSGYALARRKNPSISFGTL